MVVIIVGVLLGGGGILYSALRSSEPDLNHVLYFVDIENGDLYRVDTEKYRVVQPARHPTNRRFTLVRVTKGEGGEWEVSPRDLATLAAVEKDAKNVAVDTSTGKLLLPVKSAIDYVRKE